MAPVTVPHVLLGIWSRLAGLKQQPDAQLRRLEAQNQGGQGGSSWSFCGSRFQAFLPAARVGEALVFPGSQTRQSRLCLRRHAPTVPSRGHSGVASGPTPETPRGHLQRRYLQVGGRSQAPGLGLWCILGGHVSPQDRQGPARVCSPVRHPECVLALPSYGWGSRGPETGGLGHTAGRGGARRGRTQSAPGLRSSTKGHSLREDRSKAWWRGRSGWWSSPEAPGWTLVTLNACLVAFSEARAPGGPAGSTEAWGQVTCGVHSPQGAARGHGPASLLVVAAVGGTGRLLGGFRWERGREAAGKVTRPPRTCSSNPVITWPLTWPSAEAESVQMVCLQPGDARL
uniref:uncharacterized protein LOC129513376 n=1 Tax=Nyctereutes procyonoides TaxID=34880 RepID=UPI0024439B0F|nr:uncharacterized protein LOC129513376 [Nyctereutes procyonoides]XP_055187158.1 uncharacterized protein LOC129513376 [Nyctereutes procyonoides]